MHGHKEINRDLLNLENEWAERLLRFFFLLSADRAWAEEMVIETIAAGLAHGREPSAKRILQIAFERARHPPMPPLNPHDSVAIAVASLEPEPRLVVTAVRGLGLDLHGFCDATGTTHASAARQLAAALRQLRAALAPVGANKNGDVP